MGILNKTASVIGKVTVYAYHTPRMIVSVSGKGGRQGLSIQDLLDLMPAGVRRSGDKSAIEFIDPRDASHKTSKKNGGSNTKKNVIWERSKWNRSRGGKNMTGWEILRAHLDNHVNAVIISANTLVRQAGKSVVTAALIEGLFSTVEKTILVANGKLDLKNAAWVIVDDMYEAAKSTAKSLPIMGVMFFTPVPGITLTTITIAGGAITVYLQGSRIVAAVKTAAEAGVEENETLAVAA